MSQKYVIVHFIDNSSFPNQFPSSEWPLHVTIASNFAVKQDVTGLFEKLPQLLASKKPIELKAGEDEWFGSQKQIQVTLLETNAKLLSLHKDIIALLKDGGAAFDEPHYLEGGYKAHITVRPHSRVRKGDQIVIDNITIVDMFPDNDINQRKLLKTIKLSGK